MHIHCLQTTGAQQTRHVKPMPILGWPAVSDVGPTIIRHWFNVSCLLGDAQLTQDIDPIIASCWSNVCNAGPVLPQLIHRLVFAGR